MGYDLTTSHADRCGVCQSPDVVALGNGTRVTCVECEASGIQSAKNQWLWASGHAVRRMHAAFDDAAKRYEAA